MPYHLAKGSNGTQRRSRTYVKGLEDPCTIRYTSRAYGTEGENRTHGNGLIRAAPSPLGYLCILFGGKGWIRTNEAFRVTRAPKPSSTELQSACLATSLPCPYYLAPDQGLEP